MHLCVSFLTDLYFVSFLTLMLISFLAQLVPKLTGESLVSEQYPKKTTTTTKKRTAQIRLDAKIIRSNCLRKRIKLPLVSCYTVLFSVLQHPSFSVVLYLSRSQHSDSSSTHHENAEDFWAYFYLRTKHLWSLKSVRFSPSFLPTGSWSIYWTFYSIKVGTTLRRKTNRRTPIRGKVKLTLHLCLVSSGF